MNNSIALFACTCLLDGRVRVYANTLGPWWRVQLGGSPRGGDTAELFHVGGGREAKERVTRRALRVVVLRTRVPLRRGQQGDARPLGTSSARPHCDLVR